MNIKKILAAASASVLAVSAMAVVASADALMSKEGNEENAVAYELDLSSLTEDQVKSITKIEAKVSVTSNMVNGCIGYANAEGKWSSENQELNEDAGPVSGTWTLEAEAGDFAPPVDEDGNFAPNIQVQFWWVNPIYDADGNETGAGTASVDSVTVYAGSEVVLAVPAAATENPPAENPPAQTPDVTPGDSDGSKAPVSTGVEGVAAVIGVAVVAGGAMVVAKKRK